MTDTDRLDALLNSSAPAPVKNSALLERQIALLSRDARQASAPRRRPARVLVGAGLSLLLIGGAGTAVAATTFNWAPWAQDPDIAYAFTLPSGRMCEARVQVLRVTSVPQSGPIETAPDRVLSDHFRNFDAIAAADIDGSIAEVRDRQGDGTMVTVGDDGQLSDVPETPEGPNEDDVYAAAAHEALGDALRAEASSYGLHPDEWNTNYSIQCETNAG
jgi:hypothetical protein